MDLSRFTISGATRRLEDAVYSNRRLINIRWYYAAALVVIVGVVLAAIGQQYAQAAQYLAILALVYTVNGLLLGATFWFKRSMLAQRTIMVLQICLDLLIAMSTIFIQGGLDARTTLLFATPVIAAGLIFKNKGVYAVAIAAGLAYSGSVLAYELNSDKSTDMTVILVPALTYSIILIAQAKLANHLTNANQNEVRATAHEEFLSMISHQLRHPVSVSSTIIDVINSSAEKLSPDMQRKIGMLKGENEDLIRTINNLLAFAGQGTKLHADEIDIAALLEESARKASVAAMREADIIIDISERPLYIQGDAYKIELLFTNIIDNAFRYSDEGQAVNVALTQEGKRIVCKITDKGKGMDDAQVASAMKQPYNFRSRGTKAGPVNGLNLGLYVAQEIAHQHNGNVNIESTDKKTIVTTILEGITK